MSNELWVTSCCATRFLRRKPGVNSHGPDTADIVRARSTLLSGILANLAGLKDGVRQVVHGAHGHLSANTSILAGPPDVGVGKNTHDGAHGGGNLSGNTLILADFAGPENWVTQIVHSAGFSTSSRRTRLAHKLGLDLRRGVVVAGETFNTSTMLYKSSLDTINLLITILNEESTTLRLVDDTAPDIEIVCSRHFYY
jgi:hypothetical protein